MVRLIIIAFLLLSTCCKAQFQSKIASDHIRMDHVGPSDAMIIPIIVTIEKLKLPVPELPIQVDKLIFESLSGYIEREVDLLRKKDLNEFGVFKITKFIGGKTEIYFTGTRKKSVLFFSKFRKHLKDAGSPEELVKRVDKVLARIDY